MSKKSKINVANAISCINVFERMVEDKEIGIEMETGDLQVAEMEFTMLQDYANELLKEIKGEQ